MCHTTRWFMDYKNLTSANVFFYNIYIWTNSLWSLFHLKSDYVESLSLFFIHYIVSQLQYPLPPLPFELSLRPKVIMQGKLFQRCTNFLYGIVLSLGGNINTRQMSKSDMGSIVHIKNQRNILVIGNYYVNYQNYQNLVLLTSSDTKRTLRHLFLFTNSA